MIVDDHVDMRRLLNVVITCALNSKVKIIECESGEVALRKYPTEKPDFVLMEIELKSMSGFFVAEEILREDALANVIIVTSYDTPTFRRKAKRMNLKGFVSKDNLSEIQQILNQ